jgi:hypothetical protein
MDDQGILVGELDSLDDLVADKIPWTLKEDFS